jgi:hypothetical protein
LGSAQFGDGLTTEGDYHTSAVVVGAYIQVYDPTVKDTRKEMRGLRAQDESIAQDLQARLGNGFLRGMKQTIVFAQYEFNTIKSRTTNLKSRVEELNLNRHHRLLGDHHDLKTEVQRLRGQMKIPSFRD